MNNKITFPRLATMLADRSGRSKRFSEDFLREFFSLISETLEAGESVKIKGLGTFRLIRVEPRRSVDVTTGAPMEISGHSKVVFTPAKELAEAVNAPFEAFTAIEISDDTDIEQLLSKEEIEHQDDTEEFIQDTYDEEETKDTLITASEEKLDEILENTKTEDEDTEVIVSEKYEETSEESHVDEEERHEIISENNSKEKSLEAEDEKENDYQASESSEDASYKSNETTQEVITDDIDSETNSEPSGEIEEFEEEPSHRKNWTRGLKISLIAAVVALFATFIIWYIFATNDFNGIFNRSTKTADVGHESGFVVGIGISREKNSETMPENLLDSAVDTLQDMETEEDVPTAPSDVVVYDTISTTRYLTTMAKAHYGNYNLWPYIYEENKSFLGHPDRIRPGTPVVIPKLSKYGVDANNNADIEKAKKLGVEIYARYGKKI